MWFSLKLLFHALSKTMEVWYKFYAYVQMGFQFAWKAVYSAVWVAALSLFMELLGFSTQKWLTAGGLGTVLLTLAGREVLFDYYGLCSLFLSSLFELISDFLTEPRFSPTSSQVWWFMQLVLLLLMSGSKRRLRATKFLALLRFVCFCWTCSIKYWCQTSNTLKSSL